MEVQVDGSGFSPVLGNPVDELSPFIHKFQTDRQKYVYDVNTRRIIRVSCIVWDIIDDFAWTAGKS